MFRIRHAKNSYNYNHRLFYVNAADVTVRYQD